MSKASVELRDLTRERNLMVVAASPGDESVYCGGLIAQACAKGRPPFVAVLTDGSAIGGTLADDDAKDAAARRHARNALRATGELGVPHDWFLVLGFEDGTVPNAGPRFETAVEALRMMSWRKDCNLVAVPWARDDRPDYAAAHAIGRALVARTGIGCLFYRTEKGGDDTVALCLDDRLTAARRSRALQMHGHLPQGFEERYIASS